MNNFNTLSVDNTAVKVALLNGRVIYSALDDYSLSNAIFANAEVSAAGVTIGGGGGGDPVLPASCFPLTGRWQWEEDFTINSGDPNLSYQYEEGYTLLQWYDYPLATFNKDSGAFDGLAGPAESMLFNGQPGQSSVWPVLESGGSITLSGTYVPPGDTQPYTYYCYNTEPVPFVEAGSGSTHPFPVAPTVFARAQHYGAAPSSFTWEGLEFNVTESVNLSAWAKENGFNIPETAIGDIQLLFVDKSVTLSAVPCLMSKLQYQGLFQKDSTNGIVAWTVPQLTADGFACKPQPIVLNGTSTASDTNGELKWSTPLVLSSLVDSDLSSLTQYPTYLGTGGDSGRPLAVKVGGEYAIISHNHQVVKPTFSPTAPYYMTGPDYMVAYPAIKAYVESKGDTVKTPTAWSES